MKKNLIAIFFAICISVFAQTEKPTPKPYEQAMRENIALLTNAKSNDDFDSLTTTFTEIGDQEKKKRK